MFDAIAVSHAAATLMMAGLIWFVQVVHYPLFRLVGASDFADYERNHQRRTSMVVGPLMLVEAATALLLAVRTPVFAPLPLAGLALLAVVWASTVLLQVPAHRRLEAGFEPAALRRLVVTNWIRTAAWSGRAVIALALLAS